MNFFLWINFMCEGGIQIPENWLQMIIWYAVFIICLMLFIFSLKRKRSTKKAVLLQEKIDCLEQFESEIVSEKVMPRKDLYSGIFQLTLIRDYCKQTYESSQFVVYEEAGNCLDNALIKIKDVELKYWKKEEMQKLREEISVEIDKAGNFFKTSIIIKITRI